MATALCAGVFVSGTTPAHAAATNPTVDQQADALVQAGRIDADVLDAVRKGDADAIVSVQHDDINKDVAASTHDGNDDIKRGIADMRGRFHQRKSAVFARADHDVAVADDYENLPTSHVHIRSEQALVKLASDPDVQGIGLNHTMTKGSMDVESSNLVHQPTAAAAGYTGAGTYVAVLDTGINITKPDFGSCTANFTPSTCRAGAYETAPNDGSLDDDGHGTNVSGIVAGIAPGARILGFDVFNGATTDDSLMANAMSQVISWREQGYNIVAANLSIWTKGVSIGSSCTDTIGFGTARSIGILPVVIAGNGGYTSGVSTPGCMPGALTVGAVYDSNVGSQGPWRDGNCTDSTTYADKVVCFSQSGPNLKMLAPGSIITAAGISESGTSQAAPHVAGAAAVLAASRSWGTATAQSVGNAIESALVGSGPTILDRDGRYRHRLDVCAALTSVRGQATCDTTAPTVTAPTQSVASGWGLGTTAVPVTVSWSGSDAGGIGSYNLYQSTNGGSWVKVNLPSATATSVTLNLTPGSSYQYTVQGVDRAGNASGWANGPSFRLNDYPENSTGITYSSGWTRGAWSPAYGGYLTYSGTANASVSFTFSGRSFAWVGTKDPTRGQAYVYVDGTYTGYVDMYAGSTTAKVVALTKNWTSVGNHTVKLVVVGTSGRPTIDVDSFLVLS